MMIDFKKNTTQSGIFGDLVLRDSDADLDIEEDESKAIEAESIAIFDMTPADDIDSPLLFSKQRQAMGGEKESSILQRVKDAKRILRLIPGIDPDSIQITVDNNDVLVVSYLTNTQISVQIRA